MHDAGRHEGILGVLYPVVLTLLQRLRALEVGGAVPPALGRARRESDSAQRCPMRAPPSQPRIAAAASPTTRYALDGSVEQMPAGLDDVACADTSSRAWRAFAQ